LIPIEPNINLDILSALQSQSSPLLDQVAGVLHLLGNDLLYVLLITLFYWGLNRKIGTRMLFALVVATLTNIIIKMIVQAPRPFEEHAHIIPLFEQDGYSFPSGHTMSILVVWGYMAYAVRKTWLTVLTVLLVLLMGWSRVYGGVHYPADILGAVVFGLITLVAYIALAERFAAFWGTVSQPIRVVLLILASVLPLLILTGDSNGATIGGLILGGGLGMMLERCFVNFSTDGTMGQRLKRFVPGIILAVVLFYGLRATFSLIPIGEDALYLENVLRFVRYAILGLFGFFVYPWLGVKTGLMPKA
jgi:membrane-associated phospholipid phosphatase